MRFVLRRMVAVGHIEAMRGRAVEGTGVVPKLRSKEAMMKLGNTAAGVFVGCLSCALLASACSDKEGVLPTSSSSLMPADGGAAGAPAAAPLSPPPVPPAPQAAPPPMPAAAPSPPGAASECPLDRDVLERAAPGTYAVVFRALAPDGQVTPVFAATAFAVGPSLLATNSHVTRSLAELIAQIPYEDVVAVQAGTGTVVPLELAISHPGFTGASIAEPDVGLLTTPATLPSVLELAPAGGVTTVGVTDDVYVIGFPGDVDEELPTIPGETIPQATALPGDVTALRNFDASVPVTATSTDIIQHDAATSPGTSGAPMLHCGVVIGVNSAGTIKQVLTPDANGAAVLDRLSVANNNFGIDVKHLHELLTDYQAGALPMVDLNSHPPLASAPPEAPVELCSDTCIYAGDAECDDGGPNALPAVYCALGTDCTDCGPRLSTDAPLPPAPGETPAPETPGPETPGPLASPVVTNWAVFTDLTTGDECDTINGADFEAIALLPSNELMLVNVFDADGQATPTDSIVPSLTVDDTGRILADGALTGGLVTFAPNADGENRLWAFLPDGTLLSVAVERAGLTPDQMNDVRCDACGAVDQPAAGLCP